MEENVPLNKFIGFQLVRWFAETKIGSRILSVEMRENLGIVELNSKTRVFRNQFSTEYHKTPSGNFYVWFAKQQEPNLFRLTPAAFKRALDSK